MNLFKLVAPLALGFAFVACTTGTTTDDSGNTGDDSGQDDTSDTEDDFNDQAPEITGVLFDCNNTVADKWWFEVETAGWAEGGATLSMYETGAFESDGTGSGWIERGHEFSQGEEADVDFAANGDWDKWSVELTPGAIGDVDPGTSDVTLFACSYYDDGASLSYRVVVFDDDDNDPNTASVANDCWDFGHQPAEIDVIDDESAYNGICDDQ